MDICAIMNTAMNINIFLDEHVFFHLNVELLG
jgi:hypothetical protein